MADKKLVISGQLSIDSSKAVKALEEISKKFKSFEKSSFTKQMEDMRKLQPLVKTLDKDLAKMMQTMSKKDAKDRVKELNNVLKDQSKELKSILETQEKLNKAIKSMPSGSARDDKIREKNDVSYKARAVMGSMENFGQEREELKKLFTQDFIKKIAQGVQVAAGIGSGIAQYAGMREINNMQLQAGAQSTGNRIGSMAFNKNADLGSIAAFGDFYNVVKGSREGFAGGVGGKVLGAAGDVVGGAATGGWAGAGGALAGSAAKNAQMLDPKTRDAAFGAMRAQLENEGMDAALAKISFPRELMNTLIDQAPMKVSAMQGMVGAGQGAYGKGLSQLFGGNYRQAVKHGVEMPEAASMMQMMGQSGAIGNERGDIGAMLQMRNSGVAQSGEFGGMISSFSRISGDSTKSVSVLKRAVEEGVKLGVDRSMVKNLVRATEEIAGSQTQKIYDAQQLSDIVGQLRLAIGPNKDMSQVGISDLQTSQEAMGLFNANTPLELGVRNMVMSDYATQLGGSQMSPDMMIALSRMGKGQNLIEGSDLWNQLKEDVFNGDEDKLRAFGGRMEDLRTLSTLRTDSMYSDEAASITTLDDLDELQSDLRRSDRPDLQAAAKKKLRNLGTTEGIFASKMETGQAFANMVGGQMAPGAFDPDDPRSKLRDESGQTGAGGLARYRAALESLQQAAAGQKEIIEKMQLAMQVQLQAAKDIANNPIVQTMADGTTKLSVSMDSLKSSVDALNTTMGGKIPNAVEGARKVDAGKAVESNKKAWEEQAAQDQAVQEGRYFDAVGHSVNKTGHMLNQWWNAPNDDAIESNVDKMNNTLIPRLTPNNGSK